jgi:hypothetical protein
MSKFSPVAFALFCSFVLAHPARAQRAPELDDSRRSEVPALAMSVVLEGSVLEPSGAPAAGAVVVSSAGGKAVTDRTGAFRLEVRVPLEAESVEVTAVGAGGENPKEHARRHHERRAAASARCSSCARLVRAGLAADLRRDAGTNHNVSSLAVHDDGSGPALYLEELHPRGRGGCEPDREVGWAS